MVWVLFVTFCETCVLTVFGLRFVVWSLTVSFTVFMCSFTFEVFVFFDINEFILKGKVREETLLGLVPSVLAVGFLICLLHCSSCGSDSCLFPQRSRATV